MSFCRKHQVVGGSKVFDYDWRCGQPSKGDAKGNPLPL
jgi:hypothetical protein